MQWDLFLSSVGILGVVLSAQADSAPPVNVALKGIATIHPIEVDSLLAADKAIDDNKTSCSSTFNLLGVAWWRVDLQDVYRVTNVSITYRDNLNDAEIRIGNSPNYINNSRCAVNITINTQGRKTNTFQCNNMEGRYVIIISQTSLILCEVEVFGASADKLILVRENKSWIEALDYCRKNHSDLVSVHNEDIQHLVEAKANTASTSHIWLGLCRTCPQDFWYWVSGEFICYQNWALGNWSGGTECGRRGAVVRGGEYQWVSLHETEELNFICSN